MKQLQITPVLSGVPLAAGPPRLAGVSAAANFVLRRLAGSGDLAAEPVADGDAALAAALRGDDALALLRRAAGTGEPAWLLIPCTSRLGLNDLAPPLPLVRIEPADLLADGQRFWMIASVWTPQPVDAPEELRDKPCPVCGGALGLAPVARCACGRWMHLEKPSSPDDPDALNCFLAVGTCGGCNQPTSLEPQVMPEVPEKLAGHVADELGGNPPFAAPGEASASAGSVEENDQ